MNFTVTGVNHQTLPVQLREMFSIPDTRRIEVLNRIAVLPGVHECLVLSTCNRTEVHAVVEKNEVATAICNVILSQRRRIPWRHGRTGSFASAQDDTTPWYTHTNKDAIRHLFRVTAGLDSMVLGESEIFGQVKDAYQAAYDAGFVSTHLNRLLHRAFFTAKRVRTETGLGRGSTSVSSVAVDFLEATVCTRTTPTLLILGCGKMGTSAAKTFRDRRLGRLAIINRTHAKAQQLAADMNATAYPWNDLKDQLTQCDAVISSSGAHHPIISTAMVEEVMIQRRDRPLTFIDVGVPRDIEEGVASIAGVTLYNIDNLKEIADRNHEAREGEVQSAETIVLVETERATSAFFDTSIEPTIAELMQKCEEIRTRELSRALAGLGTLSAEQVSLLETCTTSIVKKILHGPIASLKETPAPTEELVSTVRRLFRLT